MSSGYFDMACDMWIIRDYLTKKLWNQMSDEQRKKMLHEQLDDELAGYELPDNYSAGKRAHFFADDDCEVWLGSCDYGIINPQSFMNLMPYMFADCEYAKDMLTGTPIYVVFLDGREVVNESA